MTWVKWLLWASLVLAGIGLGMALMAAKMVMPLFLDGDDEDLEEQDGCGHIEGADRRVTVRTTGSTTEGRKEED